MGEAEPAVLTEDVRRIILRVLSYGEADEGESVQLLSEKAGASTRTIYRVLGRSTETISLDLADRLLVAADGHLYECTLVWPDGRYEAP